MKHSKLLLLLGGIALLNGCAPMENAINPYEETFKCRAGEDTGECIDTTTAYKKARYPDQEVDKYIEEKPNTQNESHIKKLTVQDQRYKTLARLLEKPKKPLLQPPKILRVLLLPYKGEDEELFMTRYVYVKIENSKWILTDLVEK
jgi:conjugal transfer pilus assembly protein TraV